jgi:hypothetical protein
MLEGTALVPMGVKGGDMANRERPGPPERGSLRWELMRREKFFWKAGDLRLVHQAKDKDAPGRASSDPREGDDGRPGSGRG